MLIQFGRGWLHGGGITVVEMSKSPALTTITTISRNSETALHLPSQGRYGCNRRIRTWPAPREGRGGGGRWDGIPRFVEVVVADVSGEDAVAAL